MLKTKYFCSAMYINDRGMYFLTKYCMDLDQPMKCPMTFYLYARNLASLIMKPLVCNEELS